MGPIARGSQVVEKVNVFTIIGLKQLSHFLHLSAIFIPKKRDCTGFSVIKDDMRRGKASVV